MKPPPESSRSNPQDAQGAAASRHDRTDTVTAADGIEPPLRVNHTPGIITISNANTTIGYCRYDAAGEIEYLFVNAGYRRRGYATRLLDLVAAHVGRRLRFQAPLSPSGQQLISSYELANDRKPASRDVTAAIHVQGAAGDVTAIEQIIDRA